MFQIVLAACSNFFANIFSANNGEKSQQSLIVLEDIRALDFKHLLQFMYHGQVDIDREDLDSVLSAAQFLKIRGLIKHDSEDDEDLVETNSVNEPRWDTFFFGFSCFREINLVSADLATNSKTTNPEFSQIFEPIK